MKKYEKSEMNYDETGHYPHETEEDRANSPVVKLIENILGIVFIVWFIGCIVLMISLSRKEGSGYKIAIVLFQYFIGFGAVITISEWLKHKKFHVLPLIFIAVGIGGIAAVRAYQNGSAETRAAILKGGLSLFLLLFAGIGVYIIVSQIIGSRGNAERCTVSVTAKCISVSTSSKSVNGRTTYYYNPTYEYVCEGETYKSTVVNVAAERTVGMDYEIMIDPDSPKTVYDPDSEKNTFFMIVFGILFILIPLFMLYCLLKYAEF